VWEGEEELRPAAGGSVVGCDDRPVTEVELDEWHFYLITTVLPNPPAIPAAWIGSVVRTHVELVFPRGANTVSNK